MNVAIVLGLFALGVVTRLPFAGELLYHWDSVNFAFALERFDVHLGRPHVPGYLLYVLLGRGVSLLAGDAQRTLTCISAVGSGLSVAALYLLGAAMLDRTRGLIAALLLASSPLFWFYGAIALPHALDCFAVIAAAGLLYAVRQGREEMAIPAAVWLGIAGGLRPQTQVFLFPLAVYAAWPLGWREKVAALAVLALVDLAWFLPLIWLSGSLGWYLFVMSEFSNAFNETTSLLRGAGLAGLMRNTGKLAMYSAYGVAFAGLPLLAATPRLLRRARQWLADPRPLFLLLWTAPSIAFYVVIHMGQQGLVFVFLPAVLLVAAVALDALVARPSMLGLGTAVLIAANAVVFLAAPTYPLDGDRPKLLTADTLRRHDAALLPRLDAVRRRFRPQHALVLSSRWRFAEYYLSGYEIVPYRLISRWERGEGSPETHEETLVDPEARGLRPGPDGSFDLVVLDEILADFTRPSTRLRWLDLPNGGRIGSIKLAAGERVWLGPAGWGVGS